MYTGLVTGNEKGKEMLDISRFDGYREDNRREIKKAKGGLPKSLWETYSAFANCYGGVIILGVSEQDDGSWVTTGLTEENKLRKDFWDTVNNSTKVSVNLLSDNDVMIYNDGADSIMVINVPPASREQKPVFINNDIFRGTFRRNWEGDYHCTPGEVRAMLRDQTDQTMDMKVLEDWTVEDLNQETIQAYRNMHRSWKPGHVWGMLDDSEYLRNIGAAVYSKSDDKFYLTAAGMLMFGDEYNIVREFPEYFLDYRENMDPAIRWTDRLHSDSGEWSGNIFDFYFRVYNKIIKDVKIPFRLAGAERIDDTPVHKAIREALANCLVNTDFFLPRGVVIRKDSDRIVFENPGYIRTGKDQMRRGGESDPRNKALMKMFNLINIGERAGSGVPDIFRVWDEQDWKEPVIEERFGEAARTSLTLSCEPKEYKETIGKKRSKKTIEKNDRKKQAKKTVENKVRIMAYITQHGRSKTSDIAEHIGLSEARTRVILREMAGSGLIEAEGGTKNSVYYIKNSKTTLPVRI